MSTDDIEVLTITQHVNKTLTVNLCFRPIREASYVAIMASYISYKPFGIVATMKATQIH